MARNILKVLFCVSGNKEKNGTVPIIGRATTDGIMAQFDCKQNIPETLWDVKGNKAEGKSREAQSINLALDNVRTQIIKHYQRISDREAFVTTETVHNAYQRIGGEYETLLKAFDRENEAFEKRVGKDRVMTTYRARIRTRNHITIFIKSFYRHNDISMLELTPDLIKEFAVCLSTEAGLRNGLTWANCMWLKGMVTKAHYNGLMPRNPFIQFYISPNVKEREYLTEGELKAVMAYELADSKLACVRDILTPVSFTVLSFVDIQELTSDNIVEANGEKRILSKRHKIKVTFQVEPLDIPLQIVEYYRPIQKDDRIFPGLNYWSIYKPLKRVTRECGITKPISFRYSRHGSVMLTLSKGISTESVNRMLGHTNIVMTQLYAEITMQRFDNGLTMFGDELSKTFNGITVL